jgi:phosphatidate cytidylyltransferase
MLAKRLATGAIMAAIFVAVIIADEWLAPWYPFWLVLTTLAMGVTAQEVVGLLDRTSAKPSGNTVFGGVLALVAANWAPHVTAALTWGSPTYAAPYAPHAVDPAQVFAWPLWTFVAIVMFASLPRAPSLTSRAVRWRRFPGRCWG